MSTPQSNANHADTMYRNPEVLANNLRSQVGTSLNALRDVTGLSESAANARLQEMAVALHDARVTHDQGANFVNMANSYTIKPPDAETVDQWATETRKMLREQYGAQADTRMALVQKFIAARPELEEQLERTGLGVHPQVVGMLLDQAHNFRADPTRPRDERGRYRR